jgi:hypothetical protein
LFLKAPPDLQPPISSRGRPREPFATSVETPLQHRIGPAAALRHGRLDPRTLTPDTVGQLHQTIGNRSVRRLLDRNVRREPRPVTGNGAGLPDGLRCSIEALSGLPMDDVRVHYNSPEPTSMAAWAYTQGNTIHLRRGQQRHLAHEAWHVVQQKQGRVPPTLSLDGRHINDDRALEDEADRMGSRALRHTSLVTAGPDVAAAAAPELSFRGAGPDVVQMVSWAFIWEFLHAANNLKSAEALIKLAQGVAGAVAAFSSDNAGAAIAGIVAAIPLAIIEFWNGHQELQEVHGSADTRRAKAKKAKAFGHVLGALVALITLLVGSPAAAGFVTVISTLVVDSFGDVAAETWASMGEAADLLSIPS